MHLVRRGIRLAKSLLVFVLAVLLVSVAGGLLAMLVSHLTTFDGSNYGKDWTNTFLFGASLGPILGAFVAYALLTKPESDA